MKEIKFKDLDWYVIEEYENKVKLLLKDVLDENRIQKYSDDDWYIYGCEARMSSDVKPPFDWENSYIKRTILSNFLRDLEVDDEADLLSKEEYEQLPDDVKKSDYCYWLKTQTNNDNDNWCRVFYVDSAGYANDWSYVTSAFGVRPTLIIDKDLLEEEYSYCPYCGRKLVGQEKKE